MNYLAAYFAYISVASITPGPNNLSAFANSSKNGFVKSFPTTIGMFCKILIVDVLCALFSKTVADYIPQITEYLKIAFTAYMIWLVVKLWLPKKQKNTEESTAKSFFGGLLFQLVNAKLWLAVFSAVTLYILPNNDNTAIILLLSSAQSLIAFLCINVWAVLGQILKCSFDKHKILANIILSALLVYCIVSIYV